MPPEEFNNPLTQQGAIDFLAAADLQDHLMTATNDLERLQTLLADACTQLLEGFFGASQQLNEIKTSQLSNPEVLERTAAHLGSAATALQFQDMASQLINHTTKRLRKCADRLARDTFSGDEDGEAVVEEAPLRPNPVTQAEMDTGHVELF